jgi:hypothetical protein
MAIFIRLLEDLDKHAGLSECIGAVRSGHGNRRFYEFSPKDFQAIPGVPFAYWAESSIRSIFGSIPAFEGNYGFARQGLATAEDFRFLRLSWEFGDDRARWVGFVKGGSFSPFYADVYLRINWANDGSELKAFPRSVIRNPDFYFRPGLTWSLRTKSRLSVRVLPKNCIYSHKGPGLFVGSDEANELLSLNSLASSEAYYRLIKLQLAAADFRAGGAAHSFEVGIIQKTPVPRPAPVHERKLAEFARQAWSLKRTLDTIEEVSHAFVLPASLAARCGDYDPPAIEAELARIQAEIDKLAFDLYGFSDADCVTVQDELAPAADGEMDAADADSDQAEDEDDSSIPVDQTSGLLSWAVGVACGRFDWRLATGEREVPPEPNPFDPLPAKSPGMLPDGAAPFHAHHGILADDQGHPHDLPRLIEDVLARVGVEAPGDLRRWLQRDFFLLHLKRYSKSRRKAPIYWPLSTTSGAYTLWLYYPSLTDQTLHAAVNDFIEPKLKQVAREATALRDKGPARTRDDDKALGALQDLERELNELRGALLQIAPSWKPNHDDGVQITAAPLYELFRHRPWQTVLKDTWAKLAKGDYDWAHLAMAYWPARVREKCKTDKSLAIAHDLEDLYVAPEPKSGGRKKKGAEA